MVRRRGLGATMVASVAFSVILVAGLAVYVAAEGRAGLYAAADSADALGDGFQVLEAAEGVSLLLGVQEVVATHPLSCSTAQAYLAAAVGALSDLQGDANLTVTASAALTTSAAADDPSPALSPYNGSVAGDLDLAFAFSGSGSAGPGVTLSRADTRYAHLGLHLDRAVRDCADAAAAIGEALSGAGPAACNSTLAGAVVLAAARGPESTAAGDGFQLGVAYSVAGGGPCQVSYRLTLEQAGIQGPGGTFTARFEGGGAVALSTSAS
jgi:hypothetical protein